MALSHQTADARACGTASTDRSYASWFRVAADGVEPLAYAAHVPNSAEGMKTAASLAGKIHDCLVLNLRPDDNCPAESLVVLQTDPRASPTSSAERSALEQVRKPSIHAELDPESRRTVILSGSLNEDAFKAALTAAADCIVAPELDGWEASIVARVERTSSAASVASLDAPPGRVSSTKTAVSAVGDVGPVATLFCVMSKSTSVLGPSEVFDDRGSE
ncbi:hypothetical protein Q5752_003453 [Cryptotrichosporon argae]